MPTLGNATQINLEDVSPLFLRTGDRAPELSREAVGLSFELAHGAYTMQLTPWQNAGWRDFTLLADDTLQTGSALNGPTTPLGELTRGVRQTLTHLQVTLRDPVTQYLGLKRQQDENASACKALVMSRRMGAFYLVGIGFKGTGKRLFDWIPNFRLTPQEGWHGGFFRLAEQFLQHAGKIEFPETARELGLKTLTLETILQDMKNPHSRFRFWICGHSQGAAVMQILIARLLEAGVFPDFLSGYGFASPSVKLDARPEYRDYPIRHLLNADDVVPRVGAHWHLGQCWLFRPTQAQRAYLYQSEWDSGCFHEMRMDWSRVTDTPSALIRALGALTLVNLQSADSLRRLLSGMEQWTFLPEKLRGEGSLTAPMLDRMIEQIKEQYLALTGDDEATYSQKLAVILARYEKMAARFGLTNWFRAAMRAVSLPHRLCADTAKGEPLTAYQLLSTAAFSELVPVTDPALTARAWRVTGPQPAAASRAVPRRAPWQRPLRPARPRLPLPASLPGAPAPEAAAPSPKEPRKTSAALRQARRRLLLAARQAARQPAQKLRR